MCPVSQAVVAEYLVTTLFLFLTIGTLSSNCHTGDNVKLNTSSGVDKSLVSGEVLPLRGLFLAS
jgi:hypothetical protein